MSDGTKLGLYVVFAAAAFGVAGDYLLRGIPPGVNVPVLFLLLGGAFAFPFTRKMSRQRPGRWMVLFAAIAVVCASFVALRASPALVALDVFGVLMAVLLAVASRNWNPLPDGISGLILGAASSGIFSLAGPVPTAMKDVSWDEVAPGGWRNPAFAVLRGLLIAAPLVLVFGALLVAADAVFERAVSGIFDFDIGRVVGHAVLVLVLFWLVCGLLYLTVSSGKLPDMRLPRPRIFSLGLTEISIVLGSLNLLFFSFVVVQAGYLFGGGAVSGMTYAEYARRGFFELVAVAALVVPLLLALHWLLRRESSVARLVFRLLSGATVVLVFVMMASALWRMRLYLTEFGMTELRFYTTAFMIWLGAVLVLYLVFVLRERRDLFAVWTVLSGFVAVFALNLANPDATIAKVNIERAESGQRELDAYYLSRLSEDAAPAVIASLPETGDLQISASFSGDPATDTTTLEEKVVDKWGKTRDTDWRSWNVARARAADLTRGISP